MRGLRHHLRALRPTRHGLRARWRTLVWGSAFMLAGLSCTENAFEPLTVASVEVVGGGASLRLGQGTQLGVTLKSAQGWTMPTVGVTWTSSDSAKATVSSSGQVTASARGTVTLTASAGGVSGTTTVTVIGVQTVAIPQDSIGVIVAEQQTLAATVTADPGVTVAPNWTVRDTLVATIDATGRVTARMVGTTWAVASAEVARDSVRVQVLPVPITPPAAGSTTPVVTTVLGGAVALTIPPGATSAPALAVAPVTAAPADDRMPKAMAYTFGPAGTQFATPITVGLRFDPAMIPARKRAALELRLLEGGAAVPVPGSAVDLAGNRVTAPVSHFSTYGIFVPTDPSQVGVDAGGGQSQFVNYEVPVAPAVLVRDAQGRPVAGVLVRFDVSTGGGSLRGGLTATRDTATTNAGGVATLRAPWKLGGAVGTQTITATAFRIGNDSTVASTTLSATAVANPVARVTLTPGDTTVRIGTSVAYTVRLVDARDTVLTGRAVTWTTANGAVATVSSAGVVSAVGAGTTTLTATSEGQSASATIRVLEPVATVEVTPAAVSLLVGKTRQLAVVMKDAAGNVLTGRSVSWTSSDSAKVSVSSDGMVLALAEGSAVISASSEGKSGGSVVTVSTTPGIVVQLAGPSAVAGYYVSVSGGSLTKPVWVRGPARADGSSLLRVTVPVGGPYEVVAHAVKTIVDDGQWVNGDEVAASGRSTGVSVASGSDSEISIRTSVVGWINVKVPETARAFENFSISAELIDSSGVWATPNRAQLHYSITPGAQGIPWYPLAWQDLTKGATVAPYRTEYAVTATGQTRPATYESSVFIAHVAESADFPTNTGGTVPAPVMLYVVGPTRQTTITQAAQGVRVSSAVPAGTRAMYVEVLRTGLSTIWERSTAITSGIASIDVGLPAGGPYTVLVHAADATYDVGAGYAAITASGKAEVATVAAGVYAPISPRAAPVSMSGWTMPDSIGVGQSAEFTATLTDSTGVWSQSGYRNLTWGAPASWGCPNAPPAASALTFTATGVNQWRVSGTLSGVQSAATYDWRAVLARQSTYQSNSCFGATPGPFLIVGAPAFGAPAGTIAVVPSTSMAVATVTVSPAVVTVAQGGTQQMTVVLTDKNGTTLTGRTVTWTSSAMGIATVSPTGLVTAVATGTVTITATSEGKTATATVTVQIPVATVEVTPATATVAVGTPRQLTATLRDAQGNVVTGRTVTWTTSDAAKATVSGAGVVTPLTVGSVTIMAMSEGKSATAVLTIDLPFALAANGITVVCPVVPVGATGVVNGMTYTKRDRAGIDALLTAQNYAPLTTTCTSGITDMSSLFRDLYTFNADIASWDMSSVTKTDLMFYNARAFNRPIGAWDMSRVESALWMFESAYAFNQPVGIWNVGRLRIMDGMFRYARAFNQDLSGWDVSSAVNMDGMFSGVGTDGGVSAFNQDLSGWCVTKIAAAPALFDANVAAWTLPRPVWGTCPVAVASVEVTPATATVLVGATQQFVAVAQDAAGAVLGGRTVAWTTSDATRATVSSTGLVTAVGAGTATIRAYIGGKSSHATLTIPVPVATVEVAPATVAIVPGATQQLTAVMKDAGGATLTNRTVTWSSSAPSVATVSSTGLVTALALGSATITAVSEGRSGNTSVEVRLEGGLRAYYPLDGSALDASGSAQHGTVSGAVPTADRFGRADRAYRFNGGTNEIALGDINLTGAYTLSGWFRRTSATSGGSAIVSRFFVDNSKGWEFYTPLNGGCLVFHSRGTAGPTATCSQTLEAGRWYHAAVVFDGVSKGTIYLDGVAVTEKTGMLPDLAFTGYAAKIGRTAWGSDALVGDIDEVRIYERALTAAEVATLASDRPPVAAVEVSPGAVVVAPGATQPLTVVTKDANGVVLPGRTVTWNSSNVAVATVSGSGVVTGVASGSAMITGTSEGKSGTAVVTVQVPVNTIEITPSPLTIEIGAPQQLTATLKDAGGIVLTGRTVLWSSSNTEIVDVSTGGLATANGAGVVTVNATIEGKSAAVQVTATGVALDVAMTGPTGTGFYVLHVFGGSLTQDRWTRVVKTSEITTHRVLLPAAGTYQLRVYALDARTDPQQTLGGWTRLIGAARQDAIIIGTGVTRREVRATEVRVESVVAPAEVAMFEASDISWVVRDSSGLVQDFPSRHLNYASTSWPDVGCGATICGGIGPNPINPAVTVLDGQRRSYSATIPGQSSAGVRYWRVVHYYGTPVGILALFSPSTVAGESLRELAVRASPTQLKVSVAAAGLRAGTAVVRISGERLVTPVWTFASFNSQGIATITQGLPADGNYSVMAIGLDARTNPTQTLGSWARLVGVRRLNGFGATLSDTTRVALTLDAVSVSDLTAPLEAKVGAPIAVSWTVSDTTGIIGEMFSREVNWGSEVWPDVGCNAYYCGGNAPNVVYAGSPQRLSDGRLRYTATIPAQSAPSSLYLKIKHMIGLSLNDGNLSAIPAIFAPSTVNDEEPRVITIVP